MTQPSGRGRVTIYVHNFAPHPATSSFSATGTGSDWDTESAYSFLVVAWYTAAETNVYNAGASNYGYDTDLSTLAYEDVSAWNNKTPPHDDDIFTINWTAPDGETPHHYSVYWQKASTYDITEPGTKCNDADIPAGDTSYVILTPGDESTATNYPLITEDVAPVGFVVTESTGVEWTCAYTGSFDAWVASTVYAAGNTIYAGGNHWTCTHAGTSHSSAPTWYDEKSCAIYGNHLVSCGVGATVAISGARTVASSRLIRQAHGVMTLITCGTSIAAAAPGDNVTLYVGKATFSRPSLWGAYEAVTLEPVSQLDHDLRDRNYTTYLGHASARSLNHDSQVAGLTITGPGNWCYYYQWVNMMEWLRARATVWLIDRCDDLTDSRYPNYPQYTGKLVSANYLGSIGKNSMPIFSLSMQVEADEPQLAYVTFTPV